MSRSVVIDIKAKTGQYERALRSARSETDSLTKSLGGFAKTGALIGAAGIAAGVAAIGTAAVKVGIDAATSFATFETSLSKIEGLVGVAHESVMEFSDGLKDLAGETARGPQELADALFFITSAGLEGAEAMDALEVSAKAAAAGLGETEIIADVVTSAMNAYGDQIGGAAEATDVLVASVREGKAAAPELAASLGSVIPIASQMGVSFDEVGASIAAMTRTGLNAAEASTALRSILNSLLAPTADASKALAEMGLSAEGLKQEIRDRGLFATLEHLTDAFDGNDEATTRVFGNVRALTGVMSLMGSNADATREIFDELATSTGSLDTAFGVAAETGAFSFEQAKARIETALLGVGEDILPKLADALDDIMPMIPDLVASLGDLSIAMVNVGTQAVPHIVDGFSRAEKALLNFQLAYLGTASVVEDFNNVFDVALGPWINIDDAYTAADDSLRTWLETQRRVVELLYAGERAWDIAFEGLANLTAEGAITTERFDALQNRLGLTNAEMYEAAVAAGLFASSLGATDTELAALDAAMLRVRDTARDELIGSLRTVGEGGDYLGRSIGEAASATDDAAGSFSGDVLGSLSELELALEAAKEAGESLADVMLAATSPVFKATKAVRDLEKASVGLADIEAEIAKTRAPSEEQLRRLADAEWAAVEAALKAQAAMDGIDGFDGNNVEAAVESIQRALGKTEDEALELLEQLGIIDGTELEMYLELKTRITGPLSGALSTGDLSGAVNLGGHLGFADGGVVPGPVGAPQLAVVHGGEEVLTPEQRMLRPISTTTNTQRTVTVNVIDSNHRDLSGDISTGLIRAGVVEQVDMIGAY